VLCAQGNGRGDSLLRRIGSEPLHLLAALTLAGSPIRSSINANFARDDFQVVRGGVNYHF